MRDFARGVPDANPPAEIDTPLIDADLASAETWTTIDRRGNWRVYDYTLDQASVNETRTRNGVNEYLAIDPDGPGGPLDPVSLVYDDNGNLTLDPLAAKAGDQPGSPSGQLYDYDEENRLVAVRDATAQGNPALLEIQYDALGRRAASIDYLAETTGDPCATGQGGTGVPPVTIQHIYSGAAAIAEYQTCDGGERTLVREFLWGERFPEPLAMITHGGQSGGVGGPGVPAGETAYHYLHDALGTVVALTDPNGVEVERYACDSYGKTIIEEIDPQTGEPLSRSAASAYGSPFIWTGQRYDGGVGLYHFLFRSYSPRLGRWLQRDPLGNVDGVNLYEATASSPAGANDPFGLRRWMYHPHDRSHPNWPHIQLDDNGTTFRWDAATLRPAGRMSKTDGVRPLTVNDLVELMLCGVFDEIIKDFPALINNPHVRAAIAIAMNKKIEELGKDAFQKLAQNVTVHPFAVA